MQLLFLGTGAGLPSRQRNVSSLALKLLDELNQVWLFDCGESTQHQILKTTLKPRKIRRIFITHLHGDHIFGLPGLLSSRSFQSSEEHEALTLYGPPGLRKYVEVSLSIPKTHLTYPLEIIELNPAGGTLELEKGWTVDYLPLEHGVLSIGYRITEPDYPGELLIEKLRDYNIPNGPIFGKLKRGEEVELEDGTRLDGRDFIGEDRPGRVITITGDTRKAKNTEILAKEADVLVHESTHDANERKMAYKYFHSTCVDAAEIARDANVKKLYLNHISARYVGKKGKKLENQAKSVFSNTTVVYDLDEFDIPFN